MQVTPAVPVAGPVFKSDVDTFFGTETMDESHRILCDFMYRWLNRRDVKDLVDVLEIEGKLGVLTSDDQVERFVPRNAFSETIVRNVDSFPSMKFQSSIKPLSFKILNKHVNDRAVLLRKMRHTGAYPEPHPLIESKHYQEIDYFVKVSHLTTVRVTADQNGDWIRAVRKDRGEDIDFSCPHLQCDFRLSSKLEIPVPIPDKATARILSMRRKDRLSYKFGIWRVDMSFVEMHACDNFGNPKAEGAVRSFEVEVEVNMRLLMAEKVKMDAKVPNHFEDYVKSTLSFMRTLAKTADVSIDKLKTYGIEASGQVAAQARAAQQQQLRQQQMVIQQRARVMPPAAAAVAVPPAAAASTAPTSRIVPQRPQPQAVPARVPPAPAQQQQQQRRPHPPGHAVFPAMTRPIPNVPVPVPVPVANAPPPPPPLPPPGAVPIPVPVPVPVAMATPATGGVGALSGQKRPAQKEAEGAPAGKKAKKS